jgi:hypothetical protein
MACGRFAKAVSFYYDFCCYIYYDFCGGGWSCNLWLL